MSLPPIPGNLEVSLTTMDRENAAAACSRILSLLNSAIPAAVITQPGSPAAREIMSKTDCDAIEKLASAARHLAAISRGET